MKKIVVRKVTRDHEYAELDCSICEAEVKPQLFFNFDITIQFKVANLSTDEEETFNVEETEVCYQCWRDKVVPALTAIGCKFRSFNTDDPPEERCDHVERVT